VAPLSSRFVEVGDMEKEQRLLQVLELSAIFSSQAFALAHVTLLLPQSLKAIIDPLIASFIPVANAFFVLAVVISFCELPLKCLIS
jgi:hypothetical protein